MKRLLPVIELNEYERLWMNEAYETLFANKRPSQRQIATKLYGKIPANFHPASIDSNLINASGEDISILGIIALKGDLSVIEKIDKIINAVKDYFIEYAIDTDVEISLIAEKVRLDPIETGILISLATRYGTFYKSASITDNGIAYKSISIGDNFECFGQYLTFKGMEHQIAMYLEQNKINRARAENYSNEQIFDPVTQDIGTRFSPIFRSKVENVNKGICFVLMPFTTEWSQKVYNFLIKGNVESLGLQCLRADNLYGPIVMEDIWTQINQAGIIIADVTGKNPNVMYELGIVHTVGKPVILITQEINNIPFDFAHLRHYNYFNNDEGFISFGKQLKEIVVDIYRNRYPEYKI